MKHKAKRRTANHGQLPSLIQERQHLLSKFWACPDTAEERLLMLQNAISTVEHEIEVLTKISDPFKRMTVTGATTPTLPTRTNARPLRDILCATDWG